MTNSEARIDFYGAEWCGDCRRTQRLLDSLEIPYIHHDVEHDDVAKEQAIAISGVQSIPVVQFSDGSFFVEPSDPQLREKLVELGLIS